MPVRFLEPIIGADMAEVDAVLRTSLSSDVVLIRQIAEYIIGSGGKRLRPSLLLLAAGACGYRGRDHHTLAAVIEMIHTATLLHDDVVDESKLRRGHATANAEFGNAASVLVGDFLYSRAFGGQRGRNCDNSPRHRGRRVDRLRARRRRARAHRRARVRKRACERRESGRGPLSRWLAVIAVRRDFATIGRFRGRSPLL